MVYPRHWSTGPATSHQHSASALAYSDCAQLRDLVRRSWNK